MKRQIFAAMFLAFWLTGCQSEVNSIVLQTGRIVRDEVVGTYDATVMRATLGSAVTDVLAAGGSVVMTLETLSETSGRLIAPGLGAGGTDLDADLSGAWSFNPVTGVVTFALDDASFVGAIVYSSSRTEDFFSIRLSGTAPGDESMGVPTIDLVLHRR